MSKKPPLFYGWVIAGICALTMMLGYGVRHSFSVFFPSILEHFQWSRASTSVMLSLHILVYGLVAPIAGGLADRWRPRRVMMLGIVILGLSVGTCSLANQLWHFYLIFGFFTPIGLAFCGWPLIGPTLSNWFVKKRGLAMGIGQVGGGFSFAYGVIAEFAITEYGWRMAYVIVGASTIVVLLPLFMLWYYYRPEEKGLTADGEQEPVMNATEPEPDADKSAEWTLGEAARTYQFWLLVASQSLFWGIGCYLILAHQVKFAEDMGYSGMFAASIFALYGVFTGTGQLCSAISDKIGREWTVALAGILTISSLFALLSVTDASNPWLLYVYAVGFGFGSGLFSPTIFAGAADIFHGPNFGAISGVILTGMGVGGVIGPWLGGIVYDTTGSYKLAFGLCIVCFAVSCGCFIAAAPAKANRIKEKLLQGRATINN